MALTNIHILFVDDKERVLREAISDLRGQLEDRNITVQIETARSVSEAISKLKEMKFHLAIVDLRLPPEETGNSVIEKILNETVLPVIVYSGFTDDLDDAFRNHGFIFISPKKKVKNIIDKIDEWNSQNIFDYFSEEGYISSTIHKAFLKTMWSHLSKYWKYLNTGNTKATELTIERLVATLIYEELTAGINEAGRVGENQIHHGEVYIFDTPRKYLSVGDVLSIEDECFTVLTPNCDLVPREDNGLPKAPFILLAKCIKLVDHCKNLKIDNLFNDLSGKSISKKKEAIKNLDSLLRHSYRNDAGRYFFLPPFADIDGFAIDFLSLRTEAISEQTLINLISKREFSLNREMASELSTRYARFMIRLGQSVYEPEVLMKSIEEMWKVNSKPQAAIET